jgi:hypothetical protein
VEKITGISDRKVSKIMREGDVYEDLEKGFRIERVFVHNKNDKI